MITCQGSKKHHELVCRFYAREWPSEEETVVSVVDAIDNERGVFVRLLEYSNIEGFIPREEVSRRPLLRSRPLRQLMRVGRQEVLRVLRVEPDRGEFLS